MQWFDAVSLISGMVSGLLEQSHKSSMSARCLSSQVSIIVRHIFAYICWFCEDLAADVALCLAVHKTQSVI